MHPALLTALTGDYKSQNTNRRMERRKQGGEEGVLTVFLNGDEDRELVSARSDAKLAGDNRRSVSSQVFRSRNDISGFYPHRVMRHNAVASITRRAVAPLRFRFLKFPGILSHFAFSAGPGHVIQLVSSFKWIVLELYCLT